MKAKDLKVECISTYEESLLQNKIDDFILMNEGCEIESVSFNVNNGVSQFWYSALIFYRKGSSNKKSNPILQIFSGSTMQLLQIQVNKFLIEERVEMVSISFTELKLNYSAFVMYHVIE